MSEPRNREDVQRLLGPEGEEVSCDRCFELLDEYAEAEARGSRPAEEMPGMRAHLEGCPACREDLEALLAFITSGPGRTG
jgi:hypothetical protein